MLAKLMSFGLNGLNGYPINVEVDMHTAFLPATLSVLPTRR